MRTPEEIQARIVEVEKLMPKTHPSHRDKLRVEIYALEWVLWNVSNAKDRMVPRVAVRRGLPSKIVKNQMAKQ